jgi:hypothetical protein
MTLRTSLKICTTAMLVLGTSLVLSVPARAGTIGFTYNLSGVGTVTGMSGDFLDLSGAFTGSLNQANPAANALWNPVTYNDVSQANLSTGLLNGTFSMTFANGEMLSGSLGENVSAIISSPTGTGPFTQTLIFTAGTGEFAGVSGSASGTGFQGDVTGTVSGSGTLTAPGLITTTAPGLITTVPEPGSVALMLGGFVLIALRYRRSVRLYSVSSSKACC